MIAALLLAAGRAHRFGADKTMARMRNGTPMALATLRTLHNHSDHVVAVVRPQAPVAALLAAEGAELAFVARPESGIGHSVAAGVAPLLARGTGFRGCIVAFADMPLVRGTTFARLAAAVRHAGLPVTPEYRRTRGWPVAFPAAWFGRLAGLSDDGAVRDLLAVHRDRVLRLPVDDPGILADVDHPWDLEVLADER